MRLGSGGSRIPSPAYSNFLPLKNTTNHYSLVSTIFGKLLQSLAIFGLKLH